MNTPIREESKPNAHQLLAAALEKAWDNYRKEIKNCRDEFSNEAVHDLRVATRRMLAMIELFKSIQPRPRFKKIMQAFKDQLDDLDDLRDAQVILAEISEVLNELPQLQTYQEQLKSDEEKMLRTLRKKIKKFETSDLEKRIDKTRSSLENESDKDLEPKILQAVDDAYQLAKERLSWVDATRAITIHRVRVAFKSLRYMIEIIHPLLKDYPDENPKRMNDYQSLMGEVQDSEVFMQTLAKYAESASFPHMEPVRNYYEQRHKEAIAAYIKDMDELQTFWRPAPDQPFPWEKQE